MIARHTEMIHGICPVDGAVDYYEVTFETDTLIFVEKLREILKTYRGDKYTQEGLTQKLADASGCRVSTNGQHSAMRSVVTCLPQS